MQRGAAAAAAGAESVRTRRNPSAHTAPGAAEHRGAPPTAAAGTQSRRTLTAASGPAQRRAPAAAPARQLDRSAPARKRSRPPPTAPSPAVPPAQVSRAGDTRVSGGRPLAGGPARPRGAGRTPPPKRRAPGAAGPPPRPAAPPRLRGGPAREASQRPAPAAARSTAAPPARRPLAGAPGPVAVAPPPLLSGGASAAQRPAPAPQSGHAGEGEQTEWLPSQSEWLPSQSEWLPSQSAGTPSPPSVWLSQGTTSQDTGVQRAPSECPSFVMEAIDDSGEEADPVYDAAGWVPSPPSTPTQSQETGEVVAPPPPQQQQQQQRGSQECDRCPICFDDLFLPTLAMLSCGHSLHRECLEEWGKTCNCDYPTRCHHHETGKVQCPVCRATTTTDADPPPETPSPSVAILQALTVLSRFLADESDAQVVTIPAGANTVVRFYIAI
eukprot:TRINITY_DN204_c0_g1_i5.p1 TRINITY_DN204_c0_g1~~TRINITY_DN204_c0_g1_i5.p1  ORF type:complete len:486 (+),score=106.76 TRINITY_DN204_c0_g1_i5:142-1458(+)